MEEKKVKMRLGTAICLFIIIVLIAALICMYYFGIYKQKDNKNNINNEIANKNITVSKNETTENTETKTTGNNNFSLIYDALNKNFSMNNDEELIKSAINSITIYNDDIMNKENIPEKYNNEKYLYGECVFSSLYENAPQLAGGGFEYVAGTEGTWIVYHSYFVYNLKTKDINLSPSSDMSV